MKLERTVQYFLHPPTSGPKATLAIRLMVGGVFFWEGLLKFAYANQGVGRFTKLGMPVPDVLAPAIGRRESDGMKPMVTSASMRRCRRLANSLDCMSSVAATTW